MLLSGGFRGGHRGHVPPFFCPKLGLKECKFWAFATFQLKKSHFLFDSRPMQMGAYFKVSLCNFLLKSIDFKYLVLIEQQFTTCQTGLEVLLK